MRHSLTEVTYDPKSRCIVLYQEGQEVYYIPVYEIVSPAEYLDWILQLRAKPWIDADTIKAFLDLVEELCMRVFGKSSQGVFCPGGKARDVNWPENIARP